MDTVKNPNRFELKSPLASAFPRLQEVLETEEVMCQRIESILTDMVKKECSVKAVDLQTGNCNTQSSGPATKVDLVIVIDTSGSMGDEATVLSQAAQAAIQQASHNCPSDLRVDYFGVEGTWPGTLFNKSYRIYLNGVGISNADIIGTIGDLEDGAAAIIDLSNHYNWRPSAKRIIFYLGDEALEGGDPQNADDVTAANSAIAVANSRSVKVFTYLGTGGINATTKAEYLRVATQTGGKYYEAPIANFGGFQSVLAEIICSGLTLGCQKADKPKIIPCIHVRWGDSPDDHIETDDCEVICVSVCNPYSNVTLKDFTLNLFVVDANSQNVPTLPDGTPSVFIKPSYLIKYGDILPCDGKKNSSNCVTKQNVLITRGAKEGRYNIVMVYCFEACFHYVASTLPITINLVKS